MNAFIAVGVFVLIAIFSAVYLVYEKYKLNQGREERSFGLYFAGVLLSGWLGGGLICRIVLDFACDDNSVGCSLGAPAILFPFCAIPCIAAFVLIWVQADGE